jgi:diguanylate cyclase (GGDEF)-like protein
VAVGLIAALATYVSDTQSDARHSIRDELGRRATLSAQLISSAVLTSSSDQKVAAAFSGSRQDVSRSIRLFMNGGQWTRVILLDRNGRVLAASRSRLRRDGGLLARSPHLRAALGGRAALSDIFTWRSKRPMLELAFPVGSGARQRVVALGAPVQGIRDFADSFLAGASAVRGGQAYLPDGTGRLLATSGKEANGAPIADRDLATALQRGRSGTYGNRTFASSPVPGTRWRMVLSVPTERLYASVAGPRRTAWALFGAFSAAIVALLILGLTALRGARRLIILSEREQTARLLAHERLHDALTGLPNRALFHDRVEHALAAVTRSGQCIAVLFVDIDRFKRVNDSGGHELGDAVLLEVARRLQSAVRPADTVSRFGGDEFVVLCPDLPDAEKAMWVAARLRELFDEPVHVNGRELAINASIGVAAHCPTDPPRDVNDLIRDADVAMYRAKEHGRGRVEIFDAQLHHDALERLDAEAALRRAIERDEFVLHYQPIVTLPDHRIRGVEALVRWQPEGGDRLIPPAEFIALAEETGLISPLGELILRAAMSEVGRWARLGAVDRYFVLSVNISARQLADPALPETVADALANWELPASSLCLEITESAVAVDPEAAQRMLARLQSLGVRLAIDDFGVGQSSLGQLSRALPISVLKLDRSFIAGMSTTRDRGIVLAAASLAAALEVTSVAEGVESPEQADALAEMGFTHAQGFHFGRPVDGQQLLSSLLSLEATGSSLTA